MHSAGDEEVLYLDVVFDDAVVNQSYLALFAGVGVGVYVVRLAVGRPAGVPHADEAVNAASAVNHRAENLQAAFGLLDLQPRVFRQDGDARRVVAAVFKPLKSVQKYRSRLLAACVAYYSAHIYTPLSIQILSQCGCPEREANDMHTMISNYTTQSSREQGLYAAQNFFSGKNKKERRRAVPFRYMVEDKMKKMKNCYLRLLIYQQDVS